MKNILYMIRMTTAGAKLSFGVMEEKTALFETPIENGMKVYTDRTHMWNADRLKKKEEYMLLQSSVGPYMWGSDIDLLLRKWEITMSPQTDYEWDNKLQLVKSKLGIQQNQQADSLQYASAILKKVADELERNQKKYLSINATAADIAALREQAEGGDFLTGLAQELRANGLGSLHKPEDFHVVVQFVWQEYQTKL